MQTREDRIFRHYKSLKNRSEAREYGTGTYVWMALARTWEMPIQEVKRIIRTEKERRNASNPS